MPAALGSPESIRSGDTLRIEDLLPYSVRSGREKLEFDPEPEDNSTGNLSEANYSTRLDEILDGDEDDEGNANGIGTPSDNDEDEGFFYTGNDAPKVIGYAAQLADVLDEDDVQDPQEAEEEIQVRTELEAESQEDEIFDYSKFKVSLLYPYSKLEAQYSIQDEVLSDGTRPSTSSPLPPIPVVPDDTPSLPSRTPYLHPTVSRLRSFAPRHRTRIPSSSTLHTLHSNGFSPDPSHFSAISRVSSTSNLNELQNGNAPQPTHVSVDGSTSEIAPSIREVFRWTTLRYLSSRIYPHEAAAVDSHMGRPTALAAHGVVCIGTDTGRTFVFDFRQQLKCVCGSEASGIVYISPFDRGLTP